MGIIKNIRGPILKRIKLLPVKSFKQPEPVEEEAPANPTLMEEIKTAPTPEQIHTPTRKELTEEELAEYKANRLSEVEEEIITYREEHIGNIDQERQEKLAAGHQEGLEKAAQETQATLVELSTELRKVLTTLAGENKDIADKAKEDITTLAIRAAERMINKQLTLEPSIIQSIVDDALSRVTEKGRVIIRVNPNDSIWLKDHEDWLDQYSQDIKELIIQDDSKVEQGGCIIETKLGYIDSSIKSKIYVIEAAFQAAFQEESPTTTQLTKDTTE